MGGRVLVDSSVWVEALRDVPSACGDELDRLLLGGAAVVTTGLVVQEVLQGIRALRDCARVSSLFASLTRVNPEFGTHLRAANLYRKLRSRGISVPTIDVLLAQIAMDLRLRVWTLDGHFRQISSASKLRLHGAPAS